jgi:hypothetical protein
MGRKVVIAVTGYDGEDGEIIVNRFVDKQFQKEYQAGPIYPVIYCIGVERDNSDVVDIIDWGYMTEEDARECL